MLDLKFVCENPAAVEANLKAKKVNLDLNKIIELEKQRKQALFSFETKKAEQNKASKLIGECKKQRKPTDEIFAQMRKLSQELKQESAQISQIQNQLQTLALQLPNMLDKDVPLGDSEEENRYLKEWGKKKEFSFKPLTFWRVIKKQRKRLDEIFAQMRKLSKELAKARKRSNQPDPKPATNLGSATAQYARQRCPLGRQRRREPLPERVGQEERV